MIYVSFVLIIAGVVLVARYGLKVLVLSSSESEPTNHFMYYVLPKLLCFLGLILIVGGIILLVKGA